MPTTTPRLPTSTGTPGELFDALRSRNLLDDTLIIFTSDHGRTTIKRPGSSEQGIALAYEEVARVPLIMRLPKRLGQGIWKSGVDLAALVPTILDAAGISLTRGLPGHDQTPSVHSASLFRTLSGTDTWTDPIIIENIPQAAIDGSFFQERAVRTARHKLILRKFDMTPSFRDGELYDLESDPAESVNLYL